MNVTPCSELFDRLLALDHSRREPWGRLHGVAVACYRLQHPAALTDDAPTFPLQLLRAYLGGGIEAAGRLVGHARKANSHRVRARARPEPHRPVGMAAPTGFAYTIAEVSGDGTFPADGFDDRVRAWAEATLFAWHRS